MEIKANKNKIKGLICRDWINHEMRTVQKLLVIEEILLKNTCVSNAHKHARSRSMCQILDYAILTNKMILLHCIY